jgi:hypothetical protein
VGRRIEAASGRRWIHGACPVKVRSGERTAAASRRIGQVEVADDPGVPGRLIGTEVCDQESIGESSAEAVEDQDALVCRRDLQDLTA